MMRLDVITILSTVITINFIGELMSDNVRFKDFSRRPDPIKFMADGEEYTPHAKISAETLQDMLAAMRLSKDDVILSLNTFFSLALDEEQATRINARTKRDAKNPLDTGQATDIMRWLVEAYSSRPTQLSASSSSTSQTETSGTSSTAGAGSTE